VIDSLPILVQPQHYAQVRNGRIITAAMPAFYQKCTTQGDISGCLFEQEQPDKQCRDNRRGTTMTEITIVVFSVSSFGVFV